jgi:ketosteroid isomerase-like protein
MKPRHTLLRAALLGGALAAANAAPATAQQPGAQDVRAALEAATRLFVDAFNAGNAAAVAERYSPEAMVLAPGREPARGRDAIREFWSEALEAGGATVEFTVTSLEALGDMAIETGAVTIRVEGEVVEVDNYLVVWRREAGEWLLFRDIWNSQSGEGEA